MKRFYYLATALLLLAGAAGCKKNADVQEPETQPTGKMVPFTVSTGQSSQKTSVIGGVLSWSEGDQITVVQQDGQYPTEPLTLTAGAGTAEGSFGGEISADVQDGASLVGLYNATYSYNSSYGMSTYTASVPATQTYTEGSFQPGIYPSIGTGTYVKGGATNINFATSIFGILRVTVKGASAGDELSSVTIESLDSDKKLSGEFSLIKMGGMTNFGGGTGDKITMNCGDISFSGDGVQLNFVAPTFTFASGDLKVTVTNTKGVSYYFTYSSAVAVSANNVTKIDADITTSIAGNATRTGGEKVEWVQLWAGGPKWAEYSVGATDATSPGGYYCWGKAIDKDPDYAYCGSTSDIQGTDDDTAKTLWGTNWQMPTKTDFESIAENCDCVLITTTPKARIFKGLSETIYENNQVRFPLTGMWTSGEIRNTSFGYYWTSTPKSQNLRWVAYFNISTSTTIGVTDIYPATGRIVRAILHE